MKKQKLLRRTLVVLGILTALLVVSCISTIAAVESRGPASTDWPDIHLHHGNIDVSLEISHNPNCSLMMVSWLFCGHQTTKGRYFTIWLGITTPKGDGWEQSIRRLFILPVP